MSISSFLDQFTPVFASDTEDWVNARRSSQQRECEVACSAGLDWTPTLELAEDSWDASSAAQHTSLVQFVCLF